ncbi:MAG: hypothetical protein WCK02_04580 [Bacteroidota bacterium]
MNGLIITLFIVFFLVIIYLTPIFRFDGLNRHVLPVLFLTKVGVSFILMLLYTNIYPDRSKADIFKYFDDGKIMNEVVHENPKLFFNLLTGISNDNPEVKVVFSKMHHWYRQWENTTNNDNHFIIRVNAFLFLFSFGIYQVHSIIFCFFAFLGSVLFYRGLKNKIIELPMVVLFLFILTPTILLWTSGNLKEAILLLGLGLFFYGSFGLMKNNKIQFKNSLIAVLSIFILLSIKSYVLYLMIFLLFAYLHNSFHKVKHPIINYFGVFCLGIIAALILGKYYPSYDFVNLISYKQRDFYNLAFEQNSGSILYCPRISNSIISLILAIPVALFNVVFQPFSLSEPLKLLATFENLYLLVFPLLAIAFFNKSNFIKYQNEIIFCFAFVLVLYILIGLTTPVAGAIVRYKMPALFFYMIGFLLLIDFTKLSKYKLLSKWKILF